MDYISFQTYQYFDNGIQQVVFKFPEGPKWARGRRGYWTIVPKEFWDDTCWSGPFDTDSILNKWKLIEVFDVEDINYFEENSCTGEEIISSMNLGNRVFAYITSEFELAGLMRLGHIDNYIGPIIYIKLTTGGIQPESCYGVEVNTHSFITRPFTFGRGEWKEVSPSKAQTLWYTMLDWVLKKVALKNEPCPIKLNAETRGEYDWELISKGNVVATGQMCRDVIEFNKQFFD